MLGSCKLIDVPPALLRDARAITGGKVCERDEVGTSSAGCRTELPAPALLLGAWLALCRPGFLR